MIERVAAGAISQFVMAGFLLLVRPQPFNFVTIVLAVVACAILGAVILEGLYKLNEWAARR